MRTNNILTKQERRQRACYRVAWNIKHMWDESRTSDTRLMERPIISDELVVVGESIAGKEHREHVVPRKVLCDEAHRLYEAGETVDTVAMLLEECLKIVLITRQERKYLDSREGAGLRQRMPQGWSFRDGNVFARLHSANINFVLY